MVFLQPNEKIIVTLDNIHVKTTDAVNLNYVKYKFPLFCTITNRGMILHKYEGLISKKERIIDRIQFDQIYEQSLDNLNFRQVILKWRDHNGRAFQSVLKGNVKELIDNLEKDFTTLDSNQGKGKNNLQQPVKEIERIREIIKIKCQHCGKLYDQIENVCPHCGER